MNTNIVKLTALQSAAENMLRNSVQKQEAAYAAAEVLRGRVAELSLALTQVIRERDRSKLLFGWTAAALAVVSAVCVGLAIPR